MNIREILPAETLSLRNEVLRPGKDISEWVFEGDDAPGTRHFGAVDTDNNIVGIVSIYRKDHPDLTGTELHQIRAMAIKSSCRGRGVGRLLLPFAESYALSRGSTLIWANARSAALGFYIKRGYSAVSEEFVIEGVGPHFLVTKFLA